jgi:hypothetical protein
MQEQQELCGNDLFGSLFVSECASCRMELLLLQNYVFICDLHISVPQQSWEARDYSGVSSATARIFFYISVSKLWVVWNV